MIKSPLIVGCWGNMASRYKAILNMLGIAYYGVDINHAQDVGEVDGVIICTPTQTHCDMIKHYSQMNVPILCEKPITKDPDKLADLLKFCRENGVNLQMINQYAHMGVGKFPSDTYYNYFKSGSDGLHWDCINIRGLAKGEVTLGNDSPIWQCKVNGSHLDIKLMDYAYVEMIKSWLANPTDNLDYIKHAHNKVLGVV